MFFLIFQDVLYRDFILLLNFFAVLIFIYLPLQSAKKIKEGKILSATLGFTMYLASTGFFHFTRFIPELYPEFPFNIEFGNVGLFLNLTGMVFFVFFTERDEALYFYNQNKRKKKFSYYLTIISIICVIISYSIVNSLQMDNSLIFVFFLPAFMIAVIKFMAKFYSLEIIKHSKIVLFFSLGWAISGFSNFLNSEIMIAFFGPYTYILIPLCYILGGLMMTLCWNRFPNLSELDWMLKMERLLLIHRDSSGLLYQYDFKTTSSKDSKNQVEGSLAGSAIGGVDILLGEVLTSKGHINEIDHGNKKIIFSHGIATECILITTGTSAEFRYRLNMFHLSFEKLYGGKKLITWNGEVSQFEKTRDLISKYFSQ